VGFPGRGGSSIKLPTLRFRSKIMLGFAVVLAISAASMGFAYLGFERVSVVVDAYRRSVQEADLARDIDRELISYRSLARYFVATGKEEDGKAALAAEAGLKDAIIASMKGTTNPGRLEQIAKLEREFRAFTKIFADILKVKEESARITQNQLSRTGNSLRYKLDDLPSNAEESELQVITLGSKKVIEQFQAVTAAANTFVVNSDKTIAANALARLKFVENSLKAISSPNPKIQEGIKEVSGMLEEYRQSLAKLIDNAKEIEELTQEMTESGRGHQQGLGGDEVGPAGRSEPARCRVGCRHRRNRTADPDAGGRRFPARLHLGLLPWQGYFPADDEDVQRDARSLPPDISMSFCPASAARTNSARWQARWRNSRCRLSPAPSAMPPRRKRRTRRRAPRAAPN
jgi:CHASE3 domain sensor protein